MVYWVQVVVARQHCSNVWLAYWISMADPYLFIKTY